MKFKTYILAAGLTLMLGSCHLEDNPVPFEEEYLRNYIKMFGLIDPNQDWNLAEKSQVKMRLNRPAQKVVVYAKIGEQYYRVARCYNVPEGVVRIPLDLTVSTIELAVDVDGKVYTTTPGGSINTYEQQPQHAPSRADEEAEAGHEHEFVNQPFNEESSLGWLVLCEDLGSTDDIDFNDFVVRLEYQENTFEAYGYLTPEQWDVFVQSPDIYINRDNFTNAEDDNITIKGKPMSRATGANVLKIKALSSGGILPLWFHYRPTQNVEDDVLIGKNGVSYPTSSISGDDINSIEWHRWFGINNSAVMINTNPANRYVGATSELEVSADFSFSTYSQMKYETGSDPLNFKFDKKSIQGFYITVGGYKVDASNAYDMGKAIGHNRDFGLPPQMFLIPDICNDPYEAGHAHFRWAQERVHIDDCYPDFKNWILYGSVEHLDWYLNETSEKDCLMPDSFIKSVYGSEW